MQILPTYSIAYTEISYNDFLYNNRWYCRYQSTTDKSFEGMEVESSSESAPTDFYRYHRRKGTKLPQEIMDTYEIN